MDLELGVAVIVWDPPASDGGIPLTGYTITVAPEDVQILGPETTTTVVLDLGGRPLRMPSPSSR